MKLVTLLQSQNALGELAKLNLKATKAFEVKAFFKDVTKELQIFEEVRNEKIKQYGTTDDKGNVGIAQDNENLPKFMEEMDEAGEKEIAIDIPELIAADLGEQTVSIALISQLDWLIK